MFSSDHADAVFFDDDGTLVPGTSSSVFPAGFLDHQDGLAKAPANGTACGTGRSQGDGASVLDQTTDRDGSDVAGRRKRPGQGEADVDQRRPAQASDIGKRGPDRLGDVAVRLRPQ